jgi:hypothetical protein
MHSMAEEDTLKLRLGVPPIDPAYALPQSCPVLGAANDQDA